jgi:hypothetical protein
MFSHDPGHENTENGEEEGLAMILDTKTLRMDKRKV